MNYEVDEQTGQLRAIELSCNSKCVEVPREDRFKGLYSHILIKIDLKDALRYLERASKELDYDIRDGLFRMAVISYAKCFSPSKRGGRSPLDVGKIYAGNENEIDCHERFIEMRNKYFAHDEKDFKNALVGLLLDVDSQKYIEIIDVAQRGEFAFDDTLKILTILCEQALQKVDDMIVADKESLNSYFEEKPYYEFEGYPEIRIQTKPKTMEIDSTKD